jgi:hypothetical protein
MKATILVILAFGILAVGYLIETPSSVTTPEVKQTGDYRNPVLVPEVKRTGDYKRPVREGNCWRQFIGTGDTNSILVCG